MRMQPTPHVSLCLLVLGFCLALLLAGCSKTPNDLLQVTLSAQREAEAAAQQMDGKAAMRAAKRASAALEKLEKLATTDVAASQVVGEARLATFAARNAAELALEQQQRREVLSSLKVKAYRASREATVQALCLALATGAEQAAQQGTNDLRLGSLSLMAEARKFALWLQDGDPDSQSDPDWPAAARQFRQWSTNPPVEASLFLGLALASAGQHDLALAELETVSTNRLATTNATLVFHGARALVQAMKGWNRLALQDVNCMVALLPASDVNLSSEDLLVLVHACMAAEAGAKRDWMKVDREIAECVKVAPNSMAVAYLAGERLAADGKYEQAAESLLASAKTTEDRWFAERIAQRARDLRDGRGNSRNMVLDPEFLFDIASHMVVAKARNTEAGRKLEHLLDQAAAMGKQVRAKLPF